MEVHPVRLFKFFTISNTIPFKAVRNLEVFGETLYLSWNGSPNGLWEYDLAAKAERLVLCDDKAHPNENYCTFIIDNAYKNEIIDFLEQIFYAKKPLYSFNEDWTILKLIDRVEQDDAI